jgi:hypothetical protein
MSIHNSLAVESVAIKWLVQIRNRYYKKLQKVNSK